MNTSITHTPEHETAIRFYMPDVNTVTIDGIVDMTFGEG